jgi:hypothetical protein
VNIGVEKGETIMGVGWGLVVVVTRNHLLEKWERCPVSLLNSAKGRKDKVIEPPIIMANECYWRRLNSILTGNLLGHEHILYSIYNKHYWSGFNLPSGGGAPLGR